MSELVWKIKIGEAKHTLNCFGEKTSLDPSFYFPGLSFDHVCSSFYSLWIDSTGNWMDKLKTYKTSVDKSSGSLFLCFLNNGKGNNAKYYSILCRTIPKEKKIVYSISGVMYEVESGINKSG